VPILVYLLWKPSWYDYAITFVLYCLVGITDYFDGYLARAQKTVSRLGVFLDPIADKIMVVAVIVMLISTRQASGEPVIHDFHIVPALIILLREITVSGLANSRRDSGLRSGQPAREVEDDLSSSWRSARSSSGLGPAMDLGA
jgi:phosphatidylglycerophosphate synthase